MQMKATVYSITKFTLTILVILGQYLNCHRRYILCLIETSVSGLIPDRKRFDWETDPHSSEYQKKINHILRWTNQLIFLNWEKVSLSHMVLVFISCVQNTPQETALGVYCTAKCKIKIHVHSVSWCINGYKHLLNKQHQSMLSVVSALCGNLSGTCILLMAD